MVLSDEELIEKLVQEDEVLRALVEEHRAFEASLAELESRRYLTDEERRQVAILKKKKLQGKDRIYEILDRWRAEHGEA